MAKLINSHQPGKNIQRLRLKQGLTQEETVAKMQLLGSSLTRSTYSLIEMGRGNVFASDLVALREVFGVDYAEFFRDIPPSRPAKSEQ